MMHKPELLIKNVNKAFQLTEFFQEMHGELDSFKYDLDVIATYLAILFKENEINETTLEKIPILAKKIAKVLDPF